MPELLEIILLHNEVGYHCRGLVQHEYDHSLSSDEEYSSDRGSTDACSAMGDDEVCIVLVLALAAEVDCPCGREFLPLLSDRILWRQSHFQCPGLWQ